MIRLRWYVWVLALVGAGLLGFGLATLALGLGWLKPPELPAADLTPERPSDLTDWPSSDAGEPQEEVAAEKVRPTPSTHREAGEAESDTSPILIGTVVASDPRWSSASISHYGETSVLRLGEELLDDSRLVQIHFDRVVLSRDGQIEVLRLTERPRIPEVAADEDRGDRDGGALESGERDGSGEDGGEGDGNERDSSTLDGTNGGPPDAGL